MDSYGTILQVSARESGGGAERVASDLHRAYLDRGLDAWLAVGEATGILPRVLPLARSDRGAATTLSRLRVRLGRAIADPSYPLDRLQSLEDFSFPATRKLLDLTPTTPGILHLHNLHGGYFDLRALPALSSAVPTLVTLHDTWLTAGHCAYTLHCERWKTGCGECPDLARPIALDRDSSAENWRRKQAIYRRSRLYVVGPSQWVLRAAEQSMLAGAIVESYHVPNGVDTTVFAPGDQAAARAELDIPAKAFVIMFSAHGADSNPFKDLASIRDAIPRIVEGLPGREVLVIALGTSSNLPAEEPHVRMVPFLREPGQVARYLQAADLYVHMAHGENHPLAILEAQSSGLPVIASDLGGIPETIVAGRTGLLVPESDSVALAHQTLMLAREADHLARMATEAARHARANHSLESMTAGYLAVYAALREHGG